MSSKSVTCKTQGKVAVAPDRWTRGEIAFSIGTMASSVTLGSVAIYLGSKNVILLALTVPALLLFGVACVGLHDLTALWRGWHDSKTEAD